MKASFLDWILERLPVVAFVVYVVVQLLRGVRKTRQEAPSDEAKPDALEEERRVQEIQEQIRRRIAERRGEAPPPAAEPPPLMRREAPPPAPSPETTQMPDTFGDPLRRVLQELERRARPEPETPPPLPAVPAFDARAAELERQRKLAEEIKALEEARLATKRRAAALAAEVESRAAAASAEATSGRAREDLRDPAALRRAVVLREVLGTPVGLR
ncbi:MAG: hypothetical protein HZC55_17630 [Verrucomicrobia bacterium]|nr:hypothetical protein [Verrucomicrobiota bacterium]